MKNRLINSFTLLAIFIVGIIFYVLAMYTDIKNNNNQTETQDGLEISSMLEYPKQFTPPKPVDVPPLNQKWLDVAYAPKSDAQKMDIYLPNSGKGPFPVIVLIHGGAYKAGDKKDVLDFLPEILDNGYAAASINYRFIDESIFPAQIYDVKAAIRFIRANAASYNINPDKIITWGDSAGGHLAALAGTSGDIPALEDLTLGNPEQSSRVQAVVDWYGPINFLTIPEQFKESNLDGQAYTIEVSTEATFAGTKIGLTPELVMLANPETYITQDDPPFYIQHGTKDVIVPFQQSKNFYKNLISRINPKTVVYEEFKGAQHGDPIIRSRKNVAKILTFLDQFFK